MVIMTVAWDLSQQEPMPREQFQAAVASFVDNLPFFSGLQMKHFVFDPEGKRLGGVYFLADDADLESYWQSDYWQGAVAALGGQPRIERYLVIGKVDTASGQRQVLL